MCNNSSWILLSLYSHVAKFFFYLWPSIWFLYDPHFEFQGIKIRLKNISIRVISTINILDILKVVFWSLLAVPCCLK
jgi:hypothetical protein